MKGGRSGSLSFGVVVGSYDFPAMVRLSVATLREHAPDAPILIADDASPGEQQEALFQICRDFPDVTLWPNVQRIGHRGGAMSVFWKGLQWARALRFDVLVKLSQRALLDVPGWPDQLARDLGDANTLTWLDWPMPVPPGESNPWPDEIQPLRDDAFAMRVSAWATDRVLTHLTPRPIGEHLIWESILASEVLPMTGAVHRWSLYDQPGFLWYRGASPEQYAALAARHAIDLDADTHFRRGGEGYLPG